MPAKRTSGLRLAVILLILSFLPVTVSAQQNAKESGDEFSLPEVVARVNGVGIQSKYIQFQWNSLMRKKPRTFTAEEKRKVILEIIDQEIVRELVYQEGKAHQVKVEPEQVDEELNAIKEPYETEEAFSKALEDRKITEEDLRQSIQVDLTAKKLLDEQIRGKIHISDENVKKYYADNKDQFLRPEAFRARHIFVSIFPPALVEKSTRAELEARRDELDKEAEKKINGIFKEVQAGGNFAELAQKYSDDAGSAENGGDLDFIYKGVFDPAFDEAVFKLKPGEISDVVKTSYGYHIIKLIETKPQEQARFEEMEEAIQKHLFMEQAQKKVETYLQGLRKKAKIEVLL